MVPTEPGTQVQVAPNSVQAADEARVRGALAELDGLSAQDFAKRFTPSFEAAPQYDAASIAGLDLIQASALALNDSELSDLARQGFVLSSRQQYPTFAYGYASIYSQDLPLYVSADSVMTAVHLSYDSILEALEQSVLSQSLDRLLGGMRDRLDVVDLDAAVAADADTFLCVAQSLLHGALVTPRVGSQSEVKKLVQLAEAASGTASFTLFGVTRKDEDFSQFKPRGHYTDSGALERYFRAMMWLGRVDLRLLETQEDGSQIFRRHQLEIMVALRELVGDALLADYETIDTTVSAFVGEHDYMYLSQVDDLLADLGIEGVAGLSDFSDDELAQAIIDGDYGAQRISSHIMMNGADQGTLPLSRSFALMGQRYVVDSHVFSNVVYDRVGGRLMPSPLDAAFAALGNDQAGTLLASDLSAYQEGGYPGALAKMRYLVDDHPSDYWSGSLYTLWLGALRQLSPGATSGAADANTLFPAARSEQWGRRLLNTQLASWAELRHDTILYAKQSYTGGATCDFPDAYVDPYPAFFAALADYGTQGSQLVEALHLGASELSLRIQEHFALVTDVATRLKEMAENERTGAELTPEMLDFINDAVVIQEICGGADFQSGWYKQLFFDASKAVELSPTIADVHTQPFDEGGNQVGKVLHVGTAMPRLMVVVGEGCTGPRAYAGLASSYREVITQNFERLDDPTWQQTSATTPEVPWMQDLVSE